MTPRMLFCGRTDNVCSSLDWTAFVNTMTPRWFWLGFIIAADEKLKHHHCMQTCVHHMHVCTLTYVHTFIHTLQHSNTSTHAHTHIPTTTTQPCIHIHTERHTYENTHTNTHSLTYSNTCKHPFTFITQKAIVNSQTHACMHSYTHADIHL